MSQGGDLNAIPSAPRPLDEMWSDLQSRVARVGNTWVRQLLSAILDRHGDRLRVWPAALMVHHAYRGGLLEHVLKLAEAATPCGSYGADADLLLAGAVLHDIGSSRVRYDEATSYSKRGNLIGHITMGVMMVRMRRAIEDSRGYRPRSSTDPLAHGARALGSPVDQ